MTRAVGRVTYDELLAHLRSHVEDPELEPGMRELVDLSGVSSVALTSREVARLVDFEKEHLDRFDGARIALVAPHDLPFGLSRMYEFLSDAEETRLRVFRDEEAALTWLGASPAAD